MITIFKRHAILFVALLSSLSLKGATPSIEAQITPDSIAIGDTFTYSITVEADITQVVQFPTWTIADNSEATPIEIVEEREIDTLSREKRRVKLRKDYLLQAFQEGDINMGVAQILYLDKNIVDTLFTLDSLHLQVGTVEIDSTKQIYDIKPQKDLPFKFREIRQYTLYSLLVLLLIGVAIYLLAQYLRSRGKSLGDLFKAPPLPPAHIEAIEALESVHNKKLWQSSHYKEYYSSITDILRHYIERRYSIAAMEMTSDEILQSLREMDIPNKSAINLSSLLREADLVKFAKAEPEAEQNEEAYNVAYYFVEQTKIVEQSEENSKEEIDIKL